jgi:hypothetical protein
MSGKIRVPASAGNMSAYEYMKRCGGFLDEEDLKKISVAKERIISLLSATDKMLSLEDINSILGGDMYHTDPAMRDLVKSKRVVRKDNIKKGTGGGRSRGQFLGYVYALPEH